MKIAMGNDHTAIELKNIIKEFVESRGYEVLDLGTNSTESCDYPVYGEKVGRAVASGEADLGIAICGTGVGISLAAWMVLSLAFSYYVENFANYSVLYGSIATIVVVLLWLYMSGTVLIMGAEYSAVILRRRRSRLPESSGEEQA